MAVSRNSKSRPNFRHILIDQIRIAERTLPSLMNGAPKATRGEIVKWLNSSLLVNIPSIEKAYNGRAQYICMNA